MAGQHWTTPPGALAGWALWVTASAQAARAVALEVFYRGLLVAGARPALGVGGAVGLSLIPWMMAHYHLTWPQALAGWVTGLGLGWVAAQRGSIWAGVGLHVGAVAARAVWSAL
jgi:membrane protease YdiL (CAAX protease family)